MKQIWLIPPRNFLKPTLIALVDDKDYEFLNKYSWSYSKWQNGKICAITTINGKTVKMQKLLMPEPNKTVDHKNGDTLDNQRDNLRYASQGQQVYNRRKHKNGVTSKYKGVYEHKQGGFVAQITYNYKSMYIGIFPTEKRAAIAYNLRAKELFGEFAKLNVIED